MMKIHEVQNVAFAGDTLLLKIDGKDYRFPLAGISPALLGASASARENFEISPSGYGIHWPAIDEDLSIDGLLGVQHQPTFQDRQAVI